MEAQERGYLEQFVDDIIKHSNFLKEAKLYQKAMPPTNVKDHTMGFALGSLEAKCVAEFLRTRLPSDKVIEEIKAMIRKNLIDLSDKIDREIELGF